MAELTLIEGVDIPENAIFKSVEIVVRYQYPNDYEDCYKILNDPIIILFKEKRDER